MHLQKLMVPLPFVAFLREIGPLHILAYTSLQCQFYRISAEVCRSVISLGGHKRLGILEASLRNAAQIGNGQHFPPLHSAVFGEDNGFSGIGNMGNDSPTILSRKDLSAAN